jgi:hypothetical protein
MSAERKSLSMSEHERVTCHTTESPRGRCARCCTPTRSKVTIVSAQPRARRVQLPEGDRHTHTHVIPQAQIAI